MTAYLTRRYVFPASHRLHSAALDDARNVAIYGKCNNPHGHGHNYFVEVTLSGQVDKTTGMVCDLGTLDSFMKENVLAHFDHANLNMLPAFAGRVPTSENLCIEIYDILSRQFKAAHVAGVRLEETSKNSFEYAGGEDIRR